MRASACNIRFTPAQNQVLGPLQNPLPLLFGDDDDAVGFAEGDGLVLVGVHGHAVGQAGVGGVRADAVAEGDFAAAAGGGGDGVEVHRLAELHVAAGGLQVDLRALGVEDVGKDGVELLVLRDLRQNQADQLVADDEV